ncbi:signal peptidase II [Psychrosphaera sp. B3R10]|uniref:signal peptidase II n=1 Tax=unclassified Psychrosphaera TaxID=2641570 RepID=UPI001C09EA96|nr:MULTISPECIES: signal peptidase II [unclassified Psychrosphaera]MBU2881179.1 signal peptidase II [Psychrosphaera sp. I2R16]MBU2988284.1 signal peptidase II [Psychrosphaera sp. B3R10]MDO6718493.1 signal peptidase II [Psychrosphaera sp. 1_MG-2023]
MKLLNKFPGLLFLLLSLVVVLFDQGTKIWIINNLALYQDINVLPVFDITYVRNHGAAFSFLSDAGGWQRWFFTIIAIVISVLLTFWMAKTPIKQKLLLTAYALILGGAIGNVADRMMYGYVVDFLHFYYDSWHFPAFNIADVAISCGAALLILEAFIDFNQSKKDDNSKKIPN